MKSANDEREAPNDELVSVEIASRSKEVDSLMNKKQKLQALVLALKNPPAGNKSELIKVNFSRFLPLDLPGKLIYERV